MEKSQQKTPGMITSIGWILVVVGLLAVVVNVIAAFSYGYFVHKPGDVTAQGDLLWDYYAYWCLLLALIAGMYAVAGWQLPQRRNWARRLAVLLSLLMLTAILTIGIGVWWAFNKTGGGGVSGLGILIGMVIWCLPLLLLIFYLQRPSVRHWFESGVDLQP